MARIRTIKPEFFTHEGLAELSPLQRLFFIGLWTQADREGRLEDRPKRLKVILLPYDDCDIDSLLSDLADKGFIVRYEVDGKALLEIPGFLKHQRPHPKEPTSDIPAPIREKKRQAVKRNGETIPSPSLREGVSLREGKEIPLPSGLDPKLWEQYKDMRKKIRSPLTAHGEDLLIGDLQKLVAAGEDPIAVVETSIKRNWKGLFPVENGKGRAGPTATTDRVKEALRRGL